MRGDDHQTTRARVVSAPPTNSDGASATVRTRCQKGSELDANLECAPGVGQFHAAVDSLPGVVILELCWA
jgi:hypothetical protein